MKKPLVTTNFRKFADFTKFTKICRLRKFLVFVSQIQSLQHRHSCATEGKKNKMECTTYTATRPKLRQEKRQETYLFAKTTPAQVRRPIKFKRLSQQRVERLADAEARAAARGDGEASDESQLLQTVVTAGGTVEHRGVLHVNLAEFLEK